MGEATRRITGYPQARVDVAGVGAARPCRKPSFYHHRTDPLREGEAGALAQTGIVAVRAERSTPRDAVDPDSAQDRCEFEGQCLEGSRKSCEGLGLETVEIDFSKT